MTQSLFPLDLPQREWVQFRAAGFDAAVTGIIHRGTNAPECGLPLGGIGTGFLDIEATGLLGMSTIFNSLVEPQGPLNVPFLGMSVEGQTWVMTTLNLRKRDGYVLLDQPKQRYYRGIRTASEIHYWGHYPIVDLEYVTDAPVSVGLRAWCPFIPGDTAESNIPGSVFEVRLRNHSDRKQEGTLVFSFPGAAEEEALTDRFDRVSLHGLCGGVAAISAKASCALAVIGRGVPFRVGASLGVNGTHWARIEHHLPQTEHGAGASVASDFCLEPAQEKVIRFVLAWFAPQWMGGGTMRAGGNAYWHMYASRHHSVIDVARYLALDHDKILQRILSWQREVYADPTVPGWLQDSLINILHLLTKTSVWAQAKAPIGDWCREEDGLFAMNESPRWCPQMECIPCSFYGNQPVVYFFPDLALSTLRGYKAYQYPDGAAPWVFGGCTGGTPPYELTTPTRGYGERPMTTLDGPCYVDMVDRLWLRTGNDELLSEFYESMKRNTILTMNLRPGSGAAGVVSMPAGNVAQDWMEDSQMYGIVPHIGGIHLAQLRMMQRFAQAVGDEEFVQQCREWRRQGSAVMEEHTWTGTHYMLFNELETGKSSDVVMSCIMDGQWMALWHGLPGVFLQEHVETALATIENTSVKLTDNGALIFCKPSATTLSEQDWDPGYMGSEGVHPTGTFILAMLYMYNGRVEFGLDLARRPVHEVMRRGQTYDWPTILDGQLHGELAPRIGFDYYQQLMLWSLPAVMEGGDLAGPCKGGGLVDRIIQAGARS